MNKERLDPSWRDAVALRCRRILGTTTAGSDRLALVRTLAWLEGGRLPLVATGLELTALEREALARFGMSLVAEGEAVRLVDENTPAWWPNSLNVDPVDRRAIIPGSADALLLRLTENGSYRSQAQKAAIRALVTQPPGSGLMASLPTGAGKSLLFQMAALNGRTSNPGACVAVITPTIALALDHERSTSAIPGLEGSRALTGDQSPVKVREILDAFRRGEVPVLLLGPEAALRHDIAAQIGEAARPGAVEYGLDAKLTHLFIDEAHIVESWGRGFRPDFQRLPGLLSRLRVADPAIRLVLLSATHTQAARKVLRTGWALDGSWLEVDAHVPRYEHDVIVSDFGSHELKQEALAWAIDRVPRPGIIYTTEVKQAKTIRDWLVTERGFRRIALFTGETPAAERRSVINGWARDELDLVVATSAFGMGVDKSDVRSVIHACLPEGASRWYQEIGRSARDGGQGVAVLLFTSTGERNDDVHRARSLATGGWLTRDLAEKRWVAMMDGALEKGWEGGRFAATIDLDSIREGLRPRSSDYNRGWNMALLTLLQRARAIEILSVGDGTDEVGRTWRIAIVDDGLLDSAPFTWDRVFAERQAELEAARDEISPFLRLVLHPDRACVTRGAFEMIESGSRAPPCGRCPSCRAHGIEPPYEIPCGGLDAVWKEAPSYSGSLPPGLLLVEPDDTDPERDVGGLLGTLGRAGIEQFVVPDGLHETAARDLIASACRLGLVLTVGEWQGTNVPARLPTALLLPQQTGNSGAEVVRFAAWAAAVAVPAIVVADGSLCVGGRRIDQWLSRYAPVTEAWLRAEAAVEMAG